MVSPTHVNVKKATKKDGILVDFIRHKYPD